METIFIILLALCAFCALIVAAFIVAAIVTPPIRYAGRRPSLARRVINKLDSL